VVMPGESVAEPKSRQRLPKLIRGDSLAVCSPILNARHCPRISGGSRLWHNTGWPLPSALNPRAEETVAAFAKRLAQSDLTHSGC